MDKRWSKVRERERNRFEKRECGKDKDRDRGRGREIEVGVGVETKKERVLPSHNPSVYQRLHHIVRQHACLAGVRG